MCVTMGGCPLVSLFNQDEKGTEPQKRMHTPICMIERFAAEV